MSDRYADYREVAKKLGVEALALVPGPNFARLMHAQFGSKNGRWCSSFLSRVHRQPSCPTWSSARSPC